ncbi:MAG TPA: bifunctional precorrin-2 dehydrogenase/sirohydrochlorin ferrochelatase [Gemmatimonadaceae bacterium]|nr:bifunctional precorrin-2 dehydrogenase/sirohydrochlorin ferrochelatase [Gemmatimonadaceae bacterium]
MSGFPILVEGSAIDVLVVGGGTVASRKAAVLLDAGARVRVVTPQVSDALRALAGAGRVVLIERRYERGDIGDAHLVVAATDDRDVNAAVTADAHAAARLVNVADAPADGSFATMATHRSGALVFGVSAGGVPGAAARIRDVIARRFDARYARALEALSSLRRTLLDRGAGAEWRARAAEVIDADFCERVENGMIGERVDAWR